MFQKWKSQLLNVVVDVVYTAAIVAIILGIIMFSGDANEFIYMKF